LEQREVDQLAAALAERLGSRPADLEFASLLGELSIDDDIAPQEQADPSDALDKAIRHESEQVRDYFAAIHEAALAEGVQSAIGSIYQKVGPRLSQRLLAEVEEWKKRQEAALARAASLRAQASPHVDRLRVLLFVRAKRSGDAESG
jgi:hypothetical protein